VKGAVLAITVLALGALAGCGTARTRAGVTKAQFIAGADAICQAAQARIARVKHTAEARPHPPGAAELIRKEVSIDGEANAKLESLPEPPGDGARIEAWLTARTVAATVATDAAEAPAGNDQVAVRDVFAELARASAGARRLAREYGLEVCGATG